MGVTYGAREWKIIGYLAAESTLKTAARVMSRPHKVRGRVQGVFVLGNLFTDVENTGALFEKYFDLFMHEIYYKAWLLDGGKVRRAVALVVGHHRRCGHRQEDSMNQYAIRRWVFVSLLGGMFVLGFVSGSVSQRPAQAQVPGMGGALGSAKELGSSIVEMQQHVDGLQKNLATLKKVEAALGGGK